MKNLIKSVKALSLKQGDFIIVTVKGIQDRIDLIRVRDVLQGIDIKNDVLIFDESVYIKGEEPVKGKHKVYLNNLEYLELLAKRNS